MEPHASGKRFSPGRIPGCGTSAGLSFRVLRAFFIAFIGDEGSFAFFVFMALLLINDYSEDDNDYNGDDNDDNDDNDYGYDDDEADDDNNDNAYE